MTSDVLFNAFPKQREFINRALSRQYRYLLYGGAVRGGKSTVTMALIIMLCKMFPGSRWAIIRRDLPTIKRNTLPSFNRIAPYPSFCGDLNQSTMTIRCVNGSEIIFMAETIPTDPELNRFRGLEVNGFVLEEANELAEATFWKTIERAGSWVVPGLKDQPPILVLLTCNPSQTWVRRLFYDPHVAGTLQAPYFYLQSRIFDNPFVPEEYKKSLLNLPTEVYRQFVEGDWNVADDPFQVIPYQSLHGRLVRAEDFGELSGVPALGVDVGELGSDSTVLAYFRGAALHELEYMKGKRPDEVSELVRTRILERKIAPDRVGIDAIGVGAGVWGNLKGAGLNTQRIMAGGGAVASMDTQEFGAFEMAFKNLKTQMWWQFRQDVMNPESELQVLWKDSLVQDLTSVHYRIPEEKVIAVEAKEKTKERIGRSPDEGDAAVIGNWVRLSRVARAMSSVDIQAPPMRHTMETIRDRQFTSDRRRTW